jgi:hypothetical protein
MCFRIVTRTPGVGAAVRTVVQREERAAAGAWLQKKVAAGPSEPGGNTNQKKMAGIRQALPPLSVLHLHNQVQFIVKTRSI